MESVAPSLFTYCKLFSCINWDMEKFSAEFVALCTPTVFSVRTIQKKAQSLHSHRNLTMCPVSKAEISQPNDLVNSVPDLI